MFAVAKSCADTVLMSPSPAILPLQVRVFVLPELLVVQMGLPIKCGLAANTADGAQNSWDKASTCHSQFVG